MTAFVHATLGCHGGTRNAPGSVGCLPTPAWLHSQYRYACFGALCIIAIDQAQNRAFEIARHELSRTSAATAHRAQSTLLRPHAKAPNGSLVPAGPATSQPAAAAPTADDPAAPAAAPVAAAADLEDDDVDMADAPPADDGKIEADSVEYIAKKRALEAKLAKAAQKLQEAEAACRVARPASARSAQARALLCAPPLCRLVGDCRLQRVRLVHG
jgi:hypothetical protein